MTSAPAVFLPVPRVTTSEFVLKTGGGPAVAHGKAAFSSNSPTYVSEKRFVLNETLAGGGFSYGNNETENDSGVGPWAGATGTGGYIGFKRGGNFGWINLDYNPGSNGVVGNISVVSYDWDSGGGITQAGVSVAAVPEPAATAAIAALLAGGAAFFQRRRRKVG